MISEQITSGISLDTIESALDDIRAGKVVIVVDDEDRENEGDFICAAEKVTTEIINFMEPNGRGLIFSTNTEDRVREMVIYTLSCSYHTIYVQHIPSAVEFSWYLCADC